MKERLRTVLVITVGVALLIVLTYLVWHRDWAAMAALAALAAALAVVYQTYLYRFSMGVYLALKLDQRFWDKNVTWMGSTIRLRSRLTGEVAKTTWRLGRFFTRADGMIWMRMRALGLSEPRRTALDVWQLWFKKRKKKRRSKELGRDSFPI